MHASGVEFWTRVVEGYTFGQLLEACTAYFDTHEATSLTLIDKRTGAAIGSDALQIPVLEYFASIHSSPHDVFLFSLSDSIYEAAVAFAAAKDANPASGLVISANSEAKQSAALSPMRLATQDVEGVPLLSQRRRARVDETC